MASEGEYMRSFLANGVSALSSAPYSQCVTLLLGGIMNMEKLLEVFPKGRAIDAYSSLFQGSPCQFLNDHTKLSS